MKKKITIDDIARIAYVSKSTVSLALRNSEKVTETTKKKIYKIIKKYNYYPNSVAQQLASGKTGVIAIITTRFAGTFVTPLLSSMENYIYREKKFQDIKIQMYSTFNVTENAENILKKILYSKLADAVIVVTIKPDKNMITEYSKNKIPLVLIENDVKNTYCITINNRMGITKGMDYLVSKKRKKIIFIVGRQVPPKGEDINYSALERLQAYKEWHLKNKKEIRQENVYFSNYYSFDEGRQIAEKILKKQKLPNAIFCAAGDILAAGVMQKLQENKIKIPDDVAVVGYDNQLMSQTTNPTLTTIDQKLEDVGKFAFLTAIDALNENLSEYKKIEIIPELIVRGSA